MSASYEDSGAHDGPGASVVGVRGGSHGLASMHAAVRGLADEVDLLGDRLRSMAMLGPKVLTNGDLVESALLSPLTFKDAEVAVVLAGTGPDGLVPASVAWELTAVRVRACVRAFEEADALVAAAMDALDHTLMRTAGIPLLLGLGGWAAADPDGAQRWMMENPDLVERMTNGGGGLLDGLGDALAIPGAPWFRLPVLHPTTEAAAGTLAGFFGPEGAPTVRSGEARTGGTTPPTDLAGMLRHLERINADSPDGAIEVQSFVGPDGEPRHVVYLPGTDDFTTLPWTQDDTVRDGAANLNIFAGHDTTYAHGVVEAMHQAGIGRDEPVLIIGHSQGGMTAAHLATMDLDQTIAHVVTAGAPTAQVPALPASIGVVSLEHHGDPVPLLDGSPNADTPHQVTITFDHGGPDPGGVVAQHGLGHYVAGAEAAHASTHPSVQSALGAIAADGFLGAPGEATVQAFEITR